MTTDSMQIYITGIAGFIGFHLALSLKKKGISVRGCDAFSAYYDVSLKKNRAELLEKEGIQVETLTCEQLAQNPQRLDGVSHLVHLAAQAGVRYSLEDPASYVDTNIYGTFHVLELCKKIPNIHLLFASSSSVYGLNTKLPFSETDPVVQPANVYAATKLSTEHLAFSYHHLYGIPTCALRFFTVYGTYGRPDMAYFSFAEKIVEGQTIALFNNGDMRRDFTHISDIVSGIEAALTYPFSFEVFNLGNSTSEPLMSLVRGLEKGLSTPALLEFLPMQMGEVTETFADISKAHEMLGFSPKISLDEGIAEFSEWFLRWKKTR